AGDGDGEVSPGEPGGQIDLGERVAGRRPAQRDFERAPLLDRAGGDGGGLHAPPDHRDDQAKTPGRWLAHVISSWPSPIRRRAASRRSSPSGRGSPRRNRGSGGGRSASISRRAARDTARPTTPARTSPRPGPRGPRRPRAGPDRSGAAARSPAG